jgi:OOP family OmpA-OmpF porin
MRGVLGVAVLALGLAGLGYYAYGKSAVEIENEIAAQSLAAVSMSVHAVLPEVSGRDIRLVGLADSEAERDALIAAANAVEGRRVVIDAMTVLPKAAPFVARLTKRLPPAALVGAGVVPSVRAQLELAAEGWGDAAATLALASGAPEGWLAMAKAGAVALGHLETGEMTVADGMLTINGVALSPAENAAMEAALADIPASARTLEVSLRDDGTPAAFDLVYEAGRGAELSGKLPPRLTISALAEALGLLDISAGPTVKMGVLGDAGNIGPFAVLSRYLPDMERLRISSAPGQLTIAAEASPGVDPAALQAAMTAELGEDAAITVRQAEVTGTNGDIRINAATGQPQRYAGGYWIAVPDFVPETASCQSRTQAVLDGATINFETGSDVLSADSVAVLNSLAEVVIHCADEGALRAIIGGHTDSTGDALENLGLSQKRATAVRLALVDRGVPPLALKAIGFGAEQPIGDNATEEGKALNRRTTIDWVQ